jgi:hypothetical protein
LWFIDGWVSSRSSRTCAPFSRTFLRKRIGIEHVPASKRRLDELSRAATGFMTAKILLRKMKSRLRRRNRNFRRVGEACSDTRFKLAANTRLDYFNI